MKPRRPNVTGRLTPRGRLLASKGPFWTIFMVWGFRWSWLLKAQQHLWPCITVGKPQDRRGHRRRQTNSEAIGPKSSRTWSDQFAHSGSSPFYHQDFFSAARVKSLCVHGSIPPPYFAVPWPSLRDAATRVFFVLFFSSLFVVLKSW